MVKLEEKLKNMDLKGAREYRAKEWIKTGVGGGLLVTGLGALPGAFVLGGFGVLVGIIDSPETAVALGTIGMFGGAFTSYIGTGIYTAKKVYNAVCTGYKIKDLEQTATTEKKPE